MRARSVGCDRLAIALPTNHVERSEARHDIRHHLTGDDALEAAGDEEARWPDAYAIGRAAAVAHQIEAELAVARFRVRVHLARRDLQAFHHDLEVLDGA